MGTCPITHVLQGCNAGIGGSIELYIATFTGSHTITETDNYVSAYTTGSGTGTPFHTYQPLKNSIIITPAGTNDFSKGENSVDYTLTFRINTNESGSITAVDNLKKSITRVIHKGLSGIYKLYGKDNGCTVTAFAGANAINEGDYVEITLSMHEQDMPPIVDPTIVPALIAD